MDRLGYTALRLAAHPGDANGNSLEIRLNAHTRRNLMPRLDWADRSWQTVEIALDTLGLEPEEAITALGLSGNLTGTFYLDDIVLAIVPQPPTAVREERQQVQPERLSLEPKQPNRFDSSTQIRFGLPAPGHVELAVLNLVGQRVATLARGTRPAGSYQLLWDGTDDGGKRMASGVYVYRLLAGRQELSHKLLLLQ